MLLQNTTANFSQNETLTSSLQAISRPAVIFMRCQGTIIVLLNSFALITLVSKKSKFSSVYWLQIVCLSFNDVIAGLANFMISFIDLPYIKENLTNCSLVIVFLFSSQSASLYNIFGICIYRFVLLKRLDTSSNAWKHQHTLLCTSIAWILSLFLCSLPVVLYKKPDGYNETKCCSVQPLFGADVRKGMLILLGSFIVPLIFTNALYITLFCILRSMWKEVKPDSVSTKLEIGSLYHMGVSLKRSSNKALSNRTTMITNISNQTFFSEGLSAERSRSRERTVRSFDRDTMNSKLTLQNRQERLVSKVSKGQKTVQLLSVKSLSEPTYNKNLNDASLTCSRSNLKPLTQSQQNVPQTLMRQRKAYTFLGIILLFLNIFTLPGIVALVLTSMINTISLDRATLLPLFTTICVNSAVNPILYTISIAEFRSALFDIIFAIYKLVKC